MRQYCGLVDGSLISQTIDLYGWVDSLRQLGHLQFILLRDREGVVQVTANSEKIAPELFARVKALNLDACVKVSGTVREREAAHVNPKMRTGTVQVDLESLEVLNPCQPLPFTIVDEVKASEELRLKYRYLDLRRPRMQEVFRLRHLAAQKTREYLTAQGFWEIETPIQTKSTPEGARDWSISSPAAKAPPWARSTPAKSWVQSSRFCCCRKCLDETKWWRREHKYVDPESKYIFAYIGNAGGVEINFNSTIVNPKEFASYWDLTQPKWRGKITATDPRTRGMDNPVLFFYYHAKLGPEFIRKLYGDDGGRDRTRLSPAGGLAGVGNGMPSASPVFRTKWTRRWIRACRWGKFCG